MKIGTLIFWTAALGYATLICVAASGLLRMKIGVHKALALTALTLFSIHGGIIIFLRFFR